MRIDQAFKQGHLRLRCDPWNPYAHIELVPVREGYGPWVWLRDVGSEQKLLALDLLDFHGWEPWEPPRGCGADRCQLAELQGG